MHGHEKIRPQGLADYLEIMSKSVFQTGISWNVVESKWPGIKDAFHGFDPAKISRLTLRDVDKLVTDTRVIRNRRKIEAIIENAQKMLAIDKEHGSFRKYLRSFASYEDLAKDLKKQFRFMGDTGIYSFLWVVGEKVPPWEEWNASRPPEKRIIHSTSWKEPANAR
jgi:3-methyladenine DNA glycosylase Tag